MPAGSLMSGAAGMRRSVLYAPSVLMKPVYVTRSPTATFVDAVADGLDDAGRFDAMPFGSGTG